MSKAKAPGSEITLTVDGVPTEFVRKSDIQLMEVKQIAGSAFKVGEKYLIRTVTFTTVGLLVGISEDGFLIFTKASWIADTGRFNECLAKGTFNEVEPYPGEVGVSRGSIVDFSVWGHELPSKAK